MRSTIEKIEECIENAWYEVKKDLGNWIWWDERELVMSFYFHIRPMIDTLNRQLNKTQLYLIPEYALKASSYAKEFGEKYPSLKKGKKEFNRTKKVDLCIVAFDSYDLKHKKKDTGMTYWYIKHTPAVLLEFKCVAKVELLTKMKDEIEKLVEIEQKYDGIKRVYFCYLADETLSEKECQDMIKETRISHLSICYGTWNGIEWGYLKSL